MKNHDKCLVTDNRQLLSFIIYLNFNYKVHLVIINNCHNNKYEYERKETCLKLM